MFFRAALPILLLPTFALVARAQAHDGCPESPATLVAMRTCYRPVLVFSPNGRDARLREQVATLDSAADDMMDRNELLLPVLASRAGYQAPLDAPHRMLPPAEQARLRERFHVNPLSSGYCCWAKMAQ